VAKLKTLPTLAAVAIAMALVLSPMVASAATGSITFTSPASGASYSGTQSYTISGTISPAPTQADQVYLNVKNPSGQTVDVASVSVSNGAFSYSTATGGTSAWITGTYTISASDSYGATGTTTFSYTAPSSASFNETAILLQINATDNKILANQTTILSDLSKISGTLSTISGTLSTISGAITTMQGSLTSIASQVSSIANTVNGLGSQVSTAASNAQNAANAVSSTQTYVLVVAVLAAITLVLELAILVRKIS
jgi:hypothetical protein